MSSSSSLRILRRIRAVWWGCSISILVYSAVPLIMTEFSLDVGVSNSSVGSPYTVFLPALVFSVLATLLPFSLLGRGYVLQRQGLQSKVLSLALLRLGMTEVAVIFGVTVYFTTGSFEIFVPFPVISVIGLLLLRNEEKFYRVLLETAQAQPDS